jgi:hypothetical protein
VVLSLILVVVGGGCGWCARQLGVDGAAQGGVASVSFSAQEGGVVTSCLRCCGCGAGVSDGGGVGDLVWVIDAGGLGLVGADMGGRCAPGWAPEVSS